MLSDIFGNASFTPSHHFVFSTKHYPSQQRYEQLHIISWCFMLPSNITKQINFSRQLLSKRKNLKRLVIISCTAFPHFEVLNIIFTWPYLLINLKVVYNGYESVNTYLIKFDFNWSKF